MKATESRLAAFDVPSLSCQRNSVVAAVAIVIAAHTNTASTYAALRTIEFEGAIRADIDLGSPIVNPGDRFVGRYTFETGATITADPGFGLDTMSRAISGDLPGTGWTVFVDSTATSPFTFTGSIGDIRVGNDTSFGDRYIVTLFPESPALPLGEELRFFQIDLMDPIADGADLLNDGLFSSLPDISLAAGPIGPGNPIGVNGGRFFTGDVGSGERQIPILTTSMRIIPEPSTALLASSWLLTASVSRRRS